MRKYFLLGLMLIMVGLFGYIHYPEPIVDMGVAPIGQSTSRLIGLTSERAPACAASLDNVRPEDVTVLNRWIYLLEQWDKGIITAKERDESISLVKDLICTEIRADVSAQVVIFDGHDALVDLCIKSGCTRVIMKIDDIELL